MKTNLRQQDYHSYKWKRRELLPVGLRVVGAVVVLAWFFYRSLWAVLPLGVVGVWYFRKIEADKLQRCREELTLQFRECILSVATALNAGYSIENAFMESRRDMEVLYGEDSLIYGELEQVRRGIVVNITLEELLFDLGKRSGSEEIRQFATVFAIAKRSGGKLDEIIKSTSQLMEHRLDAYQELQIVLSGRRMEQNIMKLVPFGVLSYVGAAYPGYFSPLYHNLQGVLIMTGCLILYLAAYVLGEKILRDIMREMS